MEKKAKKQAIRVEITIDQNKMIDLLEDCDPAIRHLAYINLMIA